MADENPKASVVKSRHVVSHPLSLTKGGPKDAAAAAAAEAAKAPPARNDLRVSLVPLKQRHDRPGGKKKTPSFMSDL